MYVSVYISMYLCIYLSIYLFIYICIYLCICVSIYPFNYVCMYLSIYLSMYLCIYLHLSLSLHILWNWLMILEADKPQNLWLASYRPRRPDGVFAIQVQVQRQERIDNQFKESQAERMDPPLLFLFCSGPLWIGSCPATLSRVIMCLTQMWISSRNTLTNTPRKNV